MLHFHKTTEFICSCFNSFYAYTYFFHFCRQCWRSSREGDILVPQKTRGVVASPYMGRPAHFPYKGIIPPPPPNWRHKKFEIHIWSWRRSRHSMTHAENIPHTPTTKYAPPRWNMIHHIPPSRAHDDSKRKDVIHIDVFTNHKPTPDLIKKNKKIKWNKKNIAKGKYFSRLHVPSQIATRRWADVGLRAFGSLARRRYPTLAHRNVAHWRHVGPTFGLQPYATSIQRRPNLLTTICQPCSTSV